MNLLLHNVGPTPAGSGGCPAPAGRKSLIKVIGEEGDVSGEAITYERDDFWATTSNKQLNFVQHIKSLLKTNDRAAVIVPDNVLFEGRAGSAQAATRRLWMYDLRTNKHFTLKTKPLQRGDLEDLLARDKISRTAQRSGADGRDPRGSGDQRSPAQLRSSSRVMTPSLRFSPSTQVGKARMPALRQRSRPSSVLSHST